MSYGKYYPEMIELEALDRRLKEDVQSLASRGDNNGVEIAQLARRECRKRCSKYCHECYNLNLKKEV